MKRYEVNDGPDRLVRFTGDLLVKATSDDGERLRWLDLDIYRTKAGKYIVHQVGRTTVYHSLDSECKPKAFDLVFSERLDAEAEPCPVCQPDLDECDGIQMRMESDLHRAIVHSSARQLVEALENVNAHGKTYYSKVVRRALNEAAQQDAQIRDAFLVTEVA